MRVLVTGFSEWTDRDSGGSDSARISELSARTEEAAAASFATRTGKLRGPGRQETRAGRGQWRREPMPPRRVIGAPSRGHRRSVPRHTRGRAYEREAPAAV
ncbi:hypothetical protein MRX96_059103 [Rhipicephalus microplus]